MEEETDTVTEPTLQLPVNYSPSECSRNTETGNTTLEVGSESKPNSDEVTDPVTTETFGSEILALETDQLDTNQCVQDVPEVATSTSFPFGDSFGNGSVETEDKYKFPKIPRLTLPSDSSDVSLIQETSLDVDHETDPCSTSQPEAEDNLLNKATITGGTSVEAGDAEEVLKKLEDSCLDSSRVDSDDDNLDSEPRTKDVAATEEASEVTPYYWDYIFDASVNPLLLASTNKKDEFPASQFLKGCKWAPDGSCLLTNSDDSTLRLFNFPSNVSHIQDWDNIDTETVLADESWRSVLRISEGGCVYDYCWYPFASSLDPATTCFLSTSKDTPVHLWDAMYGNLRATYLAYNDVDEPTAAYSVAFDPTGENIYCGYEKAIRIFNISRPGRNCTVRKLTGSLLPDLNQHGLISCIAFNPAWSNVYACGSYRKKIGLYMEDGTVISVLEGHTGGVTQLIFSRDGTKLYSGARSDSSLICWDLRSMGSEYKVFNRVVKTQQRIYFDLTTNDRYLISGSTDGVVRIWDTLDEKNETIEFPCSTDCVNGVSVNPVIPVVATASGQRQVYDMSGDSNSDSDDDLYLRAKSKYDHSCNVKLWKF